MFKNSLSSLTVRHFAQNVTRFGAPSKIVCVAKNYSRQVSERDTPLQARMLNASVFMKPPSALTSLAVPVALYGATDIVGETEIALVISRTMMKSSKFLSDNDIQQSIGGIAIALDLTKKDLQNKLKAEGRPWELSKGFDGSCPISQFVETDKLPESISLRVNGQLWLDQPLSDMILSPYDLIRLITHHCSLWPGDIILTGTPTYPHPPPILKPGDQLEAHVPGVLDIRTVVV
jgi:2-keto-4-pentenoate hydratase/2-oxohepta-3-ene-1,7-dioic acid hydratase in catechol pathway